MARELNFVLNIKRKTWLIYYANDAIVEKHDLHTTLLDCLLIFVKIVEEKKQRKDRQTEIRIEKPTEQVTKKAEQHTQEEE